MQMNCLNSKTIVLRFEWLGAIVVVNYNSWKRSLEIKIMQITLEIPDTVNPPSQSDWLREVAIALFQQELIAGTIALRNN